jgi:hypothetical protein
MPNIGGPYALTLSENVLAGNWRWDRISALTGISDSDGKLD